MARGLRKLPDDFTEEQADDLVEVAPSYPTRVPSSRDLSDGSCIVWVFSLPETLFPRERCSSSGSKPFR